MTTQAWRGRIDWPVFATLAGAFVLSRVAYAFAGIRFDASLLPTALQYLEPTQLENNLVESVWYQHTQPPLFNVLLGIVLKLPFPTGATLQVLWLACGVALMALVYVLARDLGISRWIATVATIVICCSPTVVLYENWLAYEYPLTVMFTALAVASFRWVRDGSFASFAWIVGLAGAGVLTRSLLHPLWFVGLLAVLILLRRPTFGWRRAGAVVAIPTLLILGVFAKNQIVFGEPTMSSWFPWNLSRITIGEMPDDVRQGLIDDGTLSEAANFPIFLPYEDYAPIAPPCTPAHPDVPVLAETEKENGHINPNYECYLPLLDLYAKDSINAALHEPRYAVKAIIGSFQIWGESSSQYAFVHDNRQHIDDFDRYYRQFVLVDVPWNPPVKTDSGWWIPLERLPEFNEVDDLDALAALEEQNIDLRYRFSLTILFSTIAVGVLGIRSLWRRRNGPLTPIDGTLLMIAYQVVVITLIGNMFEIGENNRFRFMVEPITLVVGAWCLVQIARRLRARGAPDGVDAQDTGPSSEGSPPGPAAASEMRV